MSAHVYEPCICRHWRHSHVFDGAESVCAVEGCDCNGFHLWSVVLSDPFGGRHVVSNIQGFVRRDHPELFEDGDAEIKFCPQGGDYTRADRALMKLVDGQLENWKGWEVFTFPKTFRPT